jgi:peptidoglycan/LPS O-acetylase OafA/YrhL
MVSGGYNFDWRYSFTFTENYKMLIMDNFPKTTPLSIFWSLCIEEHFYLLWLVSLFLIPVKHVFKFLIFCFIFSWIARIVEPHIFKNALISTNDLFTNLDYFSCGGMLGYWVAKDYKRITKFIQSIHFSLKYVLILFILLIVVFQEDVLPYNPESYFILFRSSVIAILFTILIALFIPVDSKIKIKSRILNYLGTISFGLYVYHIIFIHVVFQYFINKNIKIDNWLTVTIFILITLGGSIITSILSYHYFEKPFLTLRDRLTKKKILATQKINT